MRRVMFFLVVLFMLTAIVDVGTARAKLSRWVIGGEVHPWEKWGSFRGMDPASYPGAIQLREFHPSENIVQAFEGWFCSGDHHDPDYTPGTPRVWLGIGGGYWEETCVDGDPTTVFFRYRDPFYFSYPHGVFTLDFGIPVPANRFIFYPAQEGTFQGRSRKELYIGGYRFSAGAQWPDWLEGELKPGFYPSTPDRWIYLQHFKDVVVTEPENIKSVVKIQFPLQFLQFFRLQNTVIKPYEIAEFEIYGDGFVSKAIYTSQIIDLGIPANFGKLEWVLTKWRRKTEVSEGDTLRSLELAPDASVSIGVQTRSGKDDTPLVYHIMNEKHEEEVVDKKTWERAPFGLRGQPIQPGQQASVTYDKENWSLWSLPHEVSGEEIASPGPRRYFQFQLTLETDSFREMGRIDSLWFQLSQPPLVESLVGEVACVGEPNPPEGTATVVAGKPAIFTYDVKAHFISPSQSGFDSLQVNVPSRASFQLLQIGDEDTLFTVACKDSIWGDSVYKHLVTGDSIYVDTKQPDRLVVYFPSWPIAYGSWDRLKLVFSTSVFIYGTRFTGKVWKSGVEDLPCPIQSGDATEQVTTNKLTVLLQEESVGTVLDSVWVVPNVITPNGDGANDHVRIFYQLFGLTDEARVEISIYDLSGARVREVFTGNQGSGIYHDSTGPYRCQRWDGEDDRGQLVSPGVYIYQVSVEADRGISHKIGTIAVVY